MRAAEQARLKGDLNSFVAMFGVPIDLSDDIAIRNAVVRWVEQQLVENFSWGEKVDVSEIMVILHDILRQDLHKGSQSTLEQIAEGGVEAVIRHLGAQIILDAAELLQPKLVATGKPLRSAYVERLEEPAH